MILVVTESELWTLLRNWSSKVFNTFIRKDWVAFMSRFLPSSSFISFHQSRCTTSRLLVGIVLWHWSWYLNALRRWEAKRGTIHHSIANQWLDSFPIETLLVMFTHIELHSTPTKLSTTNSKNNNRLHYLQHLKFGMCLFCTLWTNVSSRDVFL